MNIPSNTAILHIHCPDQKGIVAAVTQLIHSHNGNVLHLDQHVDFEQNVFFMRIEWALDGFDLDLDGFSAAFQPLADTYSMAWNVYPTALRQRMALFVSKQPHCLYDILSRHESGEYQVDIPLIISNHPDCGHIAERFGIPFHHLPVTPETKAAQEEKQLALLQEAHIDFVILARYMQILTPRLIEAYPNRIINIHHSFLPAFPGARPYHSAYARGVKIIGATSHYVTAELDAGPIIEQDIIRVSHRETIDDFIRRGRDLEKTVLARAIWMHLQKRILVYTNKTVLLG
jgi:formyltetrahydrofolate deformylase